MKICGIHEKTFWVCEYDEYNLLTTHRLRAFDAEGNFTQEVKTLIEEAGPKIHLGTPMQAVHEIKTETDINTYLTPERQEDLLKLFKK